MAAGNTRQGEREREREREKKNTTSIIEANIYSHLFIQMSLLAKEISERRWVVSFAKLRALWHVTIPAAAFQSIDHPSSQARGDFAFFLSCWYVYTATRLSSLWSVLALVWSRSQNMPVCVCWNSSQLSMRRGGGRGGGNICPFKTCQTLYFVVVWKLVSDPRMYLERFGVLAHSFFMSSWWLNTFTNQRRYFSGWTAGVSRTKVIKAAAVAFFCVFCYL